MKRELIPAILSKSASDAKAKFAACTDLVSWVQIDVMDGKFVKNKTWYTAETVKRWNVKPSIELHLMVKDPLSIMKAWKSVKRFKRALWHVESGADHTEILNWCKKNHIQGGLAISPETRLDTLKPYLSHPAFSRALILGVTPGWSGQTLKPSTYKKAKRLRELQPQLPIAFDGGVSAKNIPTLARNGVTAFCAASAIFESDNPRETIREFKSLIRAL